MEVRDPFPTSMRDRGVALAAPVHEGGAAPRPPAPEAVPRLPQPSIPIPLSLKRRGDGEGAVRLPPSPFAGDGGLGSVKAPGSEPPKGRSSGDELIGDLFEAMSALDFCGDSNEAASFTLQLAMEKLGSDAGIVHLYAIDTRAFVVVHAAGPGAPALIGLRTADTDLLAAEAMRTRGAFIVPEGAGDPRASGERWEALREAAGEPIACIACVRAAQAGRFLGLIELANLAGTGAFAAGDEHALTYIAERFTEFVAEHGVLLDDDASP